MAHISLDNSLNGMRKLFAYKPVIAQPMMALMEGIMRSNDGLNMGERELIASFISYLNDCTHCQNIHGEIAQCFFNDDKFILETIQSNFKDIKVSNRINAILNIAKCIHLGGKYVGTSQIQAAKNIGLSEMEIHDTVLISSLFCMFNRYIDGLGLESTDNAESFKQRAKHIAEHGYEM